MEIWKADFCQSGLKRQVVLVSKVICMCMCVQETRAPTTRVHAIHLKHAPKTQTKCIHTHTCTLYTLTHVHCNTLTHVHCTHSHMYTVTHSHMYTVTHSHMYTVTHRHVHSMHLQTTHKKSTCSVCTESTHLHQDGQHGPQDEEGEESQNATTARLLHQQPLQPVQFLLRVRWVTEAASTVKSS